MGALFLQKGRHRGAPEQLQYFLICFDTLFSINVESEITPRTQ
jgi:hypothetical protein